MVESWIPGWGRQAPWFKAAALDGVPAYAFDTVAGRHVLLLFFGASSAKPCADALRLVEENREVFDDHAACFFGVSVDPADVARSAIRQQLPGIRYFLDYDRSVSTLYGAVHEGTYRPYWLLLDPQLRVVGSFGIEQGAEAFSLLRERTRTPFPEDTWAPVLLVPNVLEGDICRHLIAFFERDGGSESGFMREIDGKTTLVTDPTYKQRRDVEIKDEKLRHEIGGRVKDRLNPMVKRAFQFEATRMERYLVACYEAGAGHFRPHRDNTTKGTAHRRFAVTINLNAGEYDGGDLRFPEYGRRTYCAPTGGAIVFSCSILHEATPVTRGRRYAFLPFLYDEAAAEARESNNQYLSENVAPSYRR
jgi:predicted 2-oxoglutarate/Fe(II)-dependent dioxygenase YbiX/peroxiredoxin